jgi:hypothetical protein
LLQGKTREARKQRFFGKKRAKNFILAFGRVDGTAWWWRAKKKIHHRDTEALRRKKTRAFFACFSVSLCLCVSVVNLSCFFLNIRHGDIAVRN